MAEIYGATTTSKVQAKTSYSSPQPKYRARKNRDRIENNVAPQFVPSNGSSVTPPSTSQIGSTGAFGAMLPRINTNVPQINTGVPQIRTGGFQPRPPISFNRATTPLVNLTGSPNLQPTVYGPPIPQGYRGSGTIAGGATTQAEIDRRRQITALTTPYQGSLAALTGANMVEPTQTGFPGTDYRQPVSVSQQYLQGGYASPSEIVAPGFDYSGGGGSGGGGGYGGGGGGGGYNYGSNIVSQVLNWRVATG